MGKNIFVSSDTKTREQVLRVLYRIQLRIINIKPWLGIEASKRLVCEDWDWLAIMQWLQDNGFVKHNPVRPPLKAFAEWLRENNVQQRNAHYSAYELSLAYRHIGGARYPWIGVKCDSGLIRRWLILYKELTTLLLEESATN